MIPKPALLTRIVKVDEQKKMALLNVDLLVVCADGLLSHSGRTAWVALHGGDWESESQRIHTRLSSILNNQVNSLLELGFDWANDF
ncbi:MAG: hypothetical protein JOZ08_00155 [Verrucomicrobia bacterium]|nr:hypothetical protein [Verrucomicrobiota bacterium]